MLELALTSLAGTCTLLAVVAVAGILLRDNSLVDVFWGPAFLAGSLAMAARSDPGPLGWVAVGMVAVWGIRLATHIARRRRSHSGEDWRYAQWRVGWGRWWWVRSLIQVYLFQALLAALGTAALVVVMASENQSLGWIAAAGMVVWAAGMWIESAADRQLERFLVRKRAGEVSGMCTTGWWGRSRHPNYFGEALLWWGMSIYALGSPNGWIGLLSGALVHTLVRYVSGVPILERAWRDRPGFDEWARRTPVFAPLPAWLRRAH